MNIEPSRRPFRPSGRIRRLAARHPVGTVVVFALPTGVAGWTLVLAHPSVHGPQVVMVGAFLLMLTPMLLIRAGAYIQRRVRAVRRHFANRRAARNPQPSGPPIEQVAANLQRLLWQHETLTRSTDVAMNSRRIWALEGSIAYSATQAARALDIPYPDRLARGSFGRPQLRRLLRELAAEGLVLPPAVELLAPDTHP